LPVALSGWSSYGQVLGDSSPSKPVSKGVRAVPPETVRLGLMGFGYIGKIHMMGARNAPLCLDSEPVRVEYVSILTTHPETAGPLARYYGVKRVYTDIDEFLDDPELMGVDISTPNSLHAPQVYAALKRNLPVYCEKPLGLNYAEARQMALAVKERGVPSLVPIGSRLAPAMLRAKAYIESGLIGDILTARAHLFHSSYLDAERPTSWRLQNSYSGGGAMADLGIHVIDRLRYLVGDVTRVSAKTRTFIADRPTTKGSKERIPVDVDDWGCAQLEFANGASGVVEASRISSGRDGTQVEVFGTKGSITIGEGEWPTVHLFDVHTDYRGLAVELDPVKRELLSLYPGSKMSMGGMVNMHMVYVLRFGLSVLRNEFTFPGAPDFEEAAAAQEVLEAAYRSSAQGGAPVDLPLP